MGSLNGAKRDARQPETGRASSSLSRPPGRAAARRGRGRDIDQVGCRLRYRDLREACASQVLRQLPQFASEAQPTVSRRAPLVLAPHAADSIDSATSPASSSARRNADWIRMTSSSRAAICPAGSPPDRAAVRLRWWLASIRRNTGVALFFGRACPHPRAPGGAEAAGSPVCLLMWQCWESPAAYSVGDLGPGDQQRAGVRSDRSDARVRELAADPLDAGRGRHGGGRHDRLPSRPCSFDRRVGAVDGSARV